MGMSKNTLNTPARADQLHRNPADVADCDQGLDFLHSGTKAVSEDVRQSHLFGPPQTARVDRAHQHQAKPDAQWFQNDDVDALDFDFVGGNQDGLGGEPGGHDGCHCHQSGQSAPGDDEVLSAVDTPACQQGNSYHQGEKEDQACRKCLLHVVFMDREWGRQYSLSFSRTRSY